MTTRELIIDRLALNSGTFREELHPRWKGRFTRKPEVGDKLRLKNPNLPKEYEEDVDYRGDLDDEKSVVATKRGQMSIPSAYLHEHEETKSKRFKKHIEELTRKQDEWVQENLDKAGDARAVRMDAVDPRMTGRYVIVSRDPVEKDKWRASSFDERGPWGHELFGSRDDAIMSFSGKRVKGHGPSNAAVGDYKVTDTMNRFASVLADRLALNAVGSKYQEYLHPRLKGKWRSKGASKPVGKGPRQGAVAPPSSRTGPDSKTMPGGQPGLPGAAQAQGQGISPAAPGAQTSKPEGQGAKTPIARQPEAAAGEKTQEDLLASEVKRLLAKESYKPMTKEKERKATANEESVAKAIGGERTGDNDAFDCLTNAGHAIEVKTIIDGKNSKITMHPKSLRRKKKYIRKNKVRAFTVVIDERSGEKEFYVRKGVGSFRLVSMTKIDGLERLMDILGEAQTKGKA